MPYGAAGRGGQSPAPLHSAFRTLAGFQALNVLACAPLDLRCFSSASTRTARRNMMLPHNTEQHDLRAFLAVTWFQPRDRDCDRKSADEGRSASFQAGFTP